MNDFCDMIFLQSISGGDAILKKERHQRILSQLRQDDFLSLEQLTDQLEASESTIRRDLDELESKGLLQRVHGGATSIHSLILEESNLEKSIKNSQFKQVLAQKALTLIESQDVIFIDAGTTTACLVDLLVNRSDLTVVTNSIHHASRLVENGIRTLIIGGWVKHSTDASIGSLAEQQLAQFNFDKAFMGMNAVDDDYYTTPDPEEAIIKRTVMDQAKISYVIVDHSKIGQYSFCRVAPITKGVLMTEGATPEKIKMIKEKTQVINL